MLHIHVSIRSYGCPVGNPMFFPEILSLAPKFRNSLLVCTESLHFSTPIFRIDNCLPLVYHLKFDTASESTIAKSHSRSKLFSELNPRHPSGTTFGPAIFDDTEILSNVV